MAIIIADVRSQRGDNTRSSKVADFSRGRTSNGRQATEHVFLTCRSRLLSSSSLFFLLLCVYAFIGASVCVIRRMGLTRYVDSLTGGDRSMVALRRLHYLTFTNNKTLDKETVDR